MVTSESEVRIPFKLFIVPAKQRLLDSTMAQPAYLTTAKRLPDIMEAIKAAAAPEKFTQEFLRKLGFSNKNDRAMVAVLKNLKFLNESGVPTENYAKYLDSTQSRRVLGQGIRAGYHELFQLNRNAQDMSREEVVGKFRSLQGGSISQAVAEKHALTFRALCDLADFAEPVVDVIDETPLEEETNELNPLVRSDERISPGLVYRIEIHLPRSDRKETYDAIFRSLREHLF